VRDVHSRDFSKKALAHGLAVGFLVSLITSVLSFLGLLESWENGVFDFLVWWEKEKRSAEVFLIEIDDSDYRDLFHSTSPLSRRVLSELLVKLARARPRVIGLDVDLSTPTAEDSLMTAALERLNEWRTPVVLSNPELPFKVPDGVFRGTVNYPLARDGVLRKMRLVQDGDGPKRTPSFALSMIAAGDGLSWETFQSLLNRGEKSPAEETGSAGNTLTLLEGSRHSSHLNIRYIGDKRSFNVLACSNFWKLPDPVLQSSTLLSGKAVLIGGTFQESRDFYPTPKGLLSGTEIIANSIETLLRAKPLTKVSHLFEFIFEAAVVVILSLAFVRFAPFKASLICLLSVVPLAVLGSFVCFSSLSRWLNFVPAAASVFLHGLFSLIEGYSKLRRDVEDLKELLTEKDRQIGKLETELNLYRLRPDDPNKGG
jgi:CHASE2 domain-containing sensor protein